MFVAISQTMASAATSTISAPLSTAAFGGTQPMLSISASAPIFYAGGLAFPGRIRQAAFLGEPFPSRF
jgi:hypothetical protein